MKQILANKIYDWDGRGIDYMVAFYHENVDNKLFFPQLIELFLEDKNLQKGVTWLIKHHFDQKKSLDNNLIHKLFLHCEEVVNWEAQLHLLQILPQVKLSPDVAPYVEQFARKAIESPKKFVRAWAYQALFELYRIIPTLKEEIIILCEQAMERESASVKARVRKVLKAIDS